MIIQRMKDFACGVMVVLATIFVSQAHAGELAPRSTATDTGGSENSALYRQLDELRSQNAILTEELKNAELKSKISGVGQTSVVPVGAATRSAGNNIGSLHSGSTAQVSMVSGVGDHLFAKIILANGSSINARVGTAVPGVGIVKSIAINEVVVANKKEMVDLPFVGDVSGPSGIR